MGLLKYLVKPTLCACALMLAGNSLVFGNGDSVHHDTIAVIPGSSRQTTAVVTQPLRFDQYFTPEVGYYFFDTDRELNNGVLIGLRYGFMVNDQFGWEGAFGVVPTNETDGTNVWFPFGTINAVFGFAPMGVSSVIPYITGGVTGDFHRGAHLGFNAGLGIKFFTGNNFAWQIEAKDRYLLEDNFNDVLVSLGLSFFFPNAQSRETVVVTSTDREDMSIVTITSDSEAQAYLEDLVIEFDANSNAIDPAYNSVLDSVARVLNNHPDVVVRVRGSSDMANAIRNAIIARGVSPTRLMVEVDSTASVNRQVEFDVI